MVYLVIMLGSLLVYGGRYQLLSTEPISIRVWWSYLIDPILSASPLLFALLDLEIVAGLWLLTGLAVCCFGYIAATKHAHQEILTADLIEDELERRLRLQLSELGKDPEIAELFRALG
jgi:hypothetical protein